MKVFFLIAVVLSLAAHSLFQVPIPAAHAQMLQIMTDRSSSLLEVLFIFIQNLFFLSFPSAVEIWQSGFIKQMISQRQVC